MDHPARASPRRQRAPPSPQHSRPPSPRHYHAQPSPRAARPPRLPPHLRPVGKAVTRDMLGGKRQHEQPDGMKDVIYARDADATAAAASGAATPRAPPQRGRFRSEAAALMYNQEGAEIAAELKRGRAMRADLQYRDDAIVDNVIYGRDLGGDRRMAAQGRGNFSLGERRERAEGKAIRADIRQRDDALADDLIYGHNLGGDRSYDARIERLQRAEGRAHRKGGDDAVVDSLVYGHDLDGYGDDPAQLDRLNRHRRGRVAPAYVRNRIDAVGGLLRDEEAGRSRGLSPRSLPRARGVAAVRSRDSQGIWGAMGGAHQESAAPAPKPVPPGFHSSSVRDSLRLDRGNVERPRARLPPPGMRSTSVRDALRLDRPAELKPPPREQVPIQNSKAVWASMKADDAEAPGLPSPRRHPPKNQLSNQVWASMKMDEPGEQVPSSPSPRREPRRNQLSNDVWASMRSDIGYTVPTPPSTASSIASWVNGPLNGFRQPQAAGGESRRMQREDAGKRIWPQTDSGIFPNSPRDLGGPAPAALSGRRYIETPRGGDRGHDIMRLAGGGCVTDAGPPPPLRRLLRPSTFQPRSDHMLDLLVAPDYPRIHEHDQTPA